MFYNCFDTNFIYTDATEGDDRPRGGVTMVLEEDWDSVGEKTPERGTVKPHFNVSHYSVAFNKTWPCHRCQNYYYFALHLL